MTDPNHTILITGYPGAGKSRLAGRLSEFAGLRAAEAAGLETTEDAAARLASTCPPIKTVICVADAVNLLATLETDHSGAFAHAQIAAADLVAITRGDVVEVTDVADRVTTITPAPVIDAREITVEMLTEITAQAQASHVAPPKATEWSYNGPAQIRDRDVDRVLEGRPSGLYRLSGELRTDKGGLAVDIVGRARETRRIDDPGETRLSALSPGCIADRRSIELWFMDAVASSTHLMGGFSYR